MSDKAGPTDSALAAWASTVMSGDEKAASTTQGVVERAPGHAHYDPADVITVFMTARESAKQRAAQSGAEADDAQPA
jgi:hypothetical protein